jgi:hypothetical protein
MTYGFARSDDTTQAQCPCCGKFPSEDDGFYAWIEIEPDFISLFCNEACVRRYEMKGGQLIDGDRQPYSIADIKQ